MVEIYKSRTEKKEKTGTGYVNCEVDDCPRAGAFECESGHFICPVHIEQDVLVPKTGRRCPICKSPVIRQVQGR